MLEKICGVVGDNIDDQLDHGWIQGKIGSPEEANQKEAGDMPAGPFGKMPDETGERCKDHSVGSGFVAFTM